VKRPGWTSSRTARRWLAVGGLVLLFLAGRVALRTFETETRLADGPRVYGTCKAPWKSARIADPGERFTLFVMTGAAPDRRSEGDAALGARCRHEARRRIALAVALLGGGGMLVWLAVPDRPRR
jgi:hypothetical protein